jgi:hypothetical protein
MQPNTETQDRKVHHQVFLGIYLNDHLAGATAGVELARRLAKSQHGSENGETLSELADAIARDRNELLDIMADLDVPIRRYKVITAWIAEKGGRLKLNGRLLNRSPLSTLVELEVLRLGVEGKAAMWRTLRAVAASLGEPQTTRLDRLTANARRQSDTLENLRMRSAASILGLPVTT